MSGHSKWSTIKHQKAAEDKKRGEVFGKLARAITVAAREDGPDPSANPKLRTAIEKAREINMPGDNIERAVERASGGGEGTTLEAFSMDAVGPGGAVLIIEGITDNRNRTVSEIRHVLETHGGKLGAEGSSRWAFKRAGVLTINPVKQESTQEALELELIQAGAEDIVPNGAMLTVVVPKEQLYKIRNELSGKGIAADETQIGWVPLQITSLPQEKHSEFTALIKKLDEQEDVQTIWSNSN